MQVRLFGCYVSANKTIACSKVLLILSEGLISKLIISLFTCHKIISLFGRPAFIQLNHFVSGHVNSLYMSKNIVAFQRSELTTNDLLLSTLL